MGTCPTKGGLLQHVVLPPTTPPMWVLPVQDFMEMGPRAPLGHQELQITEQLREWRSGMVVIFVSHQWVSRRHPDPRGLQLRELWEAMQLMLTGQLEVTYEMETELFMQQTASVGAEELGRLSEAYIWYDYWSIPQVSLAPPGRKEAVGQQLWASVMAIPDYVARSQLFLALCPEVAHEDTGWACSYNTWQERGWCRLEQMCSGLRVPVPFVTDTVLVKSARNVCLTSGHHWITKPVGEGQFTVESDRAKLEPVARALLERWTACMATSQDMLGKAKQRTMLALAPVILSGLVPALEVKESAEEEEQAFLQRFGFRTLQDRGEAGVGPMHCAAMEGRPRILAAAVAAGADVDAAVDEDMLIINMQEGFTAFMLAGAYAQMESLKLLLLLRADPERKTAQGIPALHIIALAGTMQPVGFKHDEVLELLIDTGTADVASLGPHGMPLLSTGCGWGSNRRPLEVLLKRGISTGWCTLLGGPLHMVALFGHSGPDFVELLVKHKADPNAALLPDSPLERLMLAGLQRAPSLGSSELWRLLPELNMATPLIVAALRGHGEICRSLLLHFADHERRNAAGRSALDVALAEGHTRVADLLRDWDCLSVVLFEDSVSFCL